MHAETAAAVNVHYSLAIQIIKFKNFTKTSISHFWSMSKHFSQFKNSFIIKLAELILTEM